MGEPSMKMPVSFVVQGLSEIVVSSTNDSNSEQRLGILESVRPTIFHLDRLLAFLDLNNAAVW